MMPKRALLTGASGSIGLAIAHKLAEDDFNLVLLGRSEERLRSTAEILTKTHPDVLFDVFVCDVRETAQVRATVSQIKERYSTVDAIVNCAGIPGGGFTADITDELWTDVMRTNLDGTFFVIRDALQLQLVAEGGRIINIASTGGKQGVIHAVPYSASKHAVVGLTKALGLELARNGSGITVNAVCPGFVESEMAERVRHHYASIWQTDVVEAKRRIEERVPIGRYIEPDEVAAMVSYLASPLAAGVTAQALNVCGGLGNY